MNKNYTYSCGKVFGKNLSFNGIEIQITNEDYLLSILEAAFNAGQIFKSKQIKKLLKNTFIKEPVFFIKDDEDSYKIFGPDNNLNKSLYFTELSDIDKIETVKILLEKAFESGKEERAREITRVLER